MQSEWRVFVALPLPNDAKEWLNQITKQQFAQLPNRFKRLADYRDYHITLQFLGDVLPDTVPAIMERLRHAVKGTAPFSLRMQAWNTFGRSHAPRVLWMGVEGGLEPLNNLQQSVAQGMKEIGFVPENRPYHPHITVARQYQADSGFVLPKLHPEAHQERPEWMVDRAMLYRTCLGSVPMYEEIGQAPF